MKTLYTAHATTVAGRDGHSRTDDGKLDLKLGRPGSSDEGTNPEQLFAAGYSACFGSAIDAVAKKEKASVSRVEVSADVNLNQDDSNGYFLSVTLDAKLEGVDDATANAIVAKAHHVCPYSKATRGNIEVTLKVSGSPLKQAAGVV